MDVLSLLHCKPLSLGAPKEARKSRQVSPVVVAFVNRGRFVLLLFSLGLTLHFSVVAIRKLSCDRCLVRDSDMGFTWRGLPFHSGLCSNVLLTRKSFRR